MSVTIYHNPRCSKSRTTLALLQERGIQPVVIDYLKTPPTAAEIRRLLHLLKLAPEALIRKNEAEYKAIADLNLDADGLIAAMAKFPKLIERPIVVANNRAAIGRPPENVLEII
ncbi:MAG: arsenate reductase (glutaredoxin) [Rhodospirillaceae bacterium]|nr:MAG: arsenate reductase (glutaredoxin) [Rhodospirillaceae bacterium]